MGECFLLLSFQTSYTKFVYFYNGNLILLCFGKASQI